MKLHHCGSAVCSVLLVLLILSSCKQDDDHKAAIDAWRTDRIARLSQPRGWLSLAGLYRLNPGIQTVGFGERCDVCFPGEIQRILGTVRLDSTGLYWSSDSSDITSENGATFHAGQINPDHPQLLSTGALFWTFIQRSENTYLRLWDTMSPARFDLHPVLYFPVESRWRLTSTFTPAEDGTQIVLDDVLGLRRPYPVAGYLHGKWQGESFTLTALDGEDGELFVIFEDLTTGVTTYPAGRYLYLQMPQKDSITILDFNKSLNPPCAFTEYATCLLAPPENRLDFKVDAGEKTYEH